MKSFVNTYKDYNREYREFDLQMLTFIYIEKDFKQTESQFTLIKKSKTMEENISIIISNPQR